MKNRHGYDVQEGQLWKFRSDDVVGTVVRLEPYMNGTRVVLSHEPRWGFIETHTALSNFGASKSTGLVFIANRESK